MSLPLKTEARLSGENPQEGTRLGALAEDFDQWAEICATAPDHLAAYLDGCFESEMEKADRT